MSERLSKIVQALKGVALRQKGYEAWPLKLKIDEELKKSEAIITEELKNILSALADLALRINGEQAEEVVEALEEEVKLSEQKKKVEDAKKLASEGDKVDAKK